LGFISPPMNRLKFWFSISNHSASFGQYNILHSTLKQFVHLNTFDSYNYNSDHLALLILTMPKNILALWSESPMTDFLTLRNREGIN